MEQKKFAIMMGLQGSGKSTFCRDRLFGFTRINLDTLRTRYREQLMLDECFTLGKDIVVDNTNPTMAEREKYIRRAKNEGYMIIGYFMESKLKVCIERNRLREGKERVPDTALAATSNKLQLPRYSEGFDKLYFVKNDGTNMTVEEWKTDEV